MKHMSSFADLTRFELYIITFMSVLSLILGVYPSPILDILHATTTYVLRV